MAEEETWVQEIKRRKYEVETEAKKKRIRKTIEALKERIPTISTPLALDPMEKFIFHIVVGQWNLAAREIITTWNDPYDIYILELVLLDDEDYNRLFTTQKIWQRKLENDFDKDDTLNNAQQALSRELGIDSYKARWLYWSILVSNEFNYEMPELEEDEEYDGTEFNSNYTFNSPGKTISLDAYFESNYNAFILQMFFEFTTNALLGFDSVIEDADSTFNQTDITRDITIIRAGDSIADVVVWVVYELFKNGYTLIKIDEQEKYGGGIKQCISCANSPLKCSLCGVPMCALCFESHV